MTSKKNGSPVTSGGSLDSQFRGILAKVHVERSVLRMLALVLASFVFFAVLNPGVFLNSINLQNIAISTPEIGIISIAMMIAMLTGGIDLSLVAIANLTAVTIAMIYGAASAADPALAESYGPLIVLFGFLVGVLAGAFNGILIAYVGIVPILATLGTMQIFNGLAVVWTGGSTIYGVPAFLTSMGSATFLGVPVLFWIFVLVAVLVAVLLGTTALGAKIGLQGANPLAAQYSGISSSRVLMSTYVVTGALGAIAGILFISRNPTASADYGLSYVLLAIVIAVLGGTNPAGGFATVTGVALAAVVLQIVSSGFTALRLSAYEYSIAQGVILIVVLVIDQVDFRFRRRLKADVKEQQVVRSA